MEKAVKFFQSREASLWTYPENQAPYAYVAFPNKLATQCRCQRTTMTLPLEQAERLAAQPHEADYVNAFVDTVSDTEMLSNFLCEKRRQIHQWESSNNWDRPTFSNHSSISRGALLVATSSELGKLCKRKQHEEMGSGVSSSRGYGVFCFCRSSKLSDEAAHRKRTKTPTTFLSR
jgi:hypothetical protein